MLVGMNQKQTDEYNENQCKQIADELEKVVDGERYVCPHCGGIVEVVVDHCKEVCVDCLGEVDTEDYSSENYAEQASLYDYFTDGIYGEHYVVDSENNVEGAIFMVACGGPNIWIDSWEEVVRLSWWFDKASYPLSTSVVAELNKFAEELRNC